MWDADPVQSDTSLRSTNPISRKVRQGSSCLVSKQLEAKDVNCQPGTRLRVAVECGMRLGIRVGTTVAPHSSGTASSCNQQTSNNTPRAPRPPHD